MAALQLSGAETTTCKYDSIPINLVNVDIFRNFEFEEKFVNVFNTNELNPSCKMCYINFCKLLFCLLVHYDGADEVNILYNYTKVFIQHCYRDIMHTIKYCPRTATEFHSEKRGVLTCIECVGKCVYIIECTARSFYGMDWRPSVTFGVASTHVYKVFILFLLECKNSCLDDDTEDDGSELMDFF